MAHLGISYGPSWCVTLLATGATAEPDIPLFVNTGDGEQPFVSLLKATNLHVGNSSAGPHACLIKLGAHWQIVPARDEPPATIPSIHWHSIATATRSDAAARTVHAFVESLLGQFEETTDIALTSIQSVTVASNGAGSSTIQTALQSGIRRALHVEPAFVWAPAAIAGSALLCGGVLKRLGADNGNARINVQNSKGVVVPVRFSRRKGRLIATAVQDGSGGSPNGHVRWQGGELEAMALGAAVLGRLAHIDAVDVVDQTTPHSIVVRQPSDRRMKLHLHQSPFSSNDRPMITFARSFCARPPLRNAPTFAIKACLPGCKYEFTLATYSLSRQEAVSKWEGMFSVVAAMCPEEGCGEVLLIPPRSSDGQAMRVWLIPNRGRLEPTPERGEVPAALFEPAVSSGAWPWRADPPSEAMALLPARRSVLSSTCFSSAQLLAIYFGKTPAHIRVCGDAKRESSLAMTRLGPCVHVGAVTPKSIMSANEGEHELRLVHETPGSGEKGQPTIVLSRTLVLTPPAFGLEFDIRWDHNWNDLLAPDALGISNTSEGRRALTPSPVGVAVNTRGDSITSPLIAGELVLDNRGSRALAVELEPSPGVRIARTSVRIDPGARETLRMYRRRSLNAEVSAQLRDVSLKSRTIPLCSGDEYAWPSTISTADNDWSEPVCLLPQEEQEWTLSWGKTLSIPVRVAGDAPRRVRARLASQGQPFRDSNIITLDGAGSAPCRGLLELQFDPVEVVSAFPGPVDDLLAIVEIVAGDESDGLITSQVAIRARLETPLLLDRVIRCRYRAGSPYVLTLPMLCPSRKLVRVRLAGRDKPTVRVSSDGASANPATPLSTVVERSVPNALRLKNKLHQKTVQLLVRPCVCTGWSAERWSGQLRLESRGGETLDEISIHLDAEPFPIATRVEFQRGRQHGQQGAIEFQFSIRNTNPYSALRLRKVQLSLRVGVSFGPMRKLIVVDAEVDKAFYQGQAIKSNAAVTWSARVHSEKTWWKRLLMRFANRFQAVIDLRAVAEDQHGGGRAWRAAIDSPLRAHSRTIAEGEATCVTSTATAGASSGEVDQS